MLNQISEIYADKILEPVEPMRSSLDEEKIFELANSIKKSGLINPITVRPKTIHGKGCKLAEFPNSPCDSNICSFKYEIVAGHRRFKACLIAGIVKIPCAVKEISESQMIEIRAHENLFRVDLDPVEEAMAIGKLVGEDEGKIPEIAGRMNKSLQWVKDRLEILEYPDYLIENLKLGKISLGVAKYLGRILDDGYRSEYVRQAVGGNMSVLTAQYVFNLWSQGLLKDSAALLSGAEKSESGQSPKVHAICAKCGLDAESPNLKSVFIHVECPVPEAEKEGAVS